MSLILCAVPKIYKIYESRKLDKNIRASKKEIKKNIQNLESILVDAENKVYQEKIEDYSRIWDCLKQAENELHVIANSLIFPKNKENKKLSNKQEFYSNLENIEKALEPTYKMTQWSAICLENSEHFRDYISTIRQTISSDKSNLEENIKIYEETHKNSKITELSKNNRIRNISNGETHVITANNYISNVYSKIAYTPPDYSPTSGRILKKSKKWKSKHKNLKFKTKYGRINPKLSISCTYSDEEPDFSKLRKMNKKSKNYNIQCYVMPIASESFKEFVSRYMSPSKGIFLHELSTGKTIYNENCDFAEIFSDYLKPEINIPVKCSKKITEKLMEKSDGNFVNISQSRRFGEKFHKDLVKMGVAINWSDDRIFITNQEG